MAVRGIGGSRAYVITSRVDPQSTANYYAKLVTDQKYKLWEEAQKIALQDIQTETELYKAELGALDDLRRQRAAANKQRGSLETKQINTRNALRKDYLRAKASYDKGYRTSTGGSTTDPSKDEGKFLIETRLLKGNYDREVGRKQSQLKPKEAAYNDMVLLSTQFDPAGVALFEDIEALKRSKAQSDANAEFQNKIIMAFATPAQQEASGYDKPQLAQIKAEIIEAKGVSSETAKKHTSTIVGRTAPSQEAYQTEAQAAAAEFDQPLSDLQAEIDAIDAQILQFSAQKPDADLLGRTRRIASEEFGMDNRNSSMAGTGGRRRLFGERQSDVVGQAIEEGGMESQPLPSPANIPSMTAERRAELEALGTDDAWLQKTLGIESDPLPPEAIREPVVTGDIDPVTSQTRLQNFKARERAEARAFQESPATRLFSEAAGYPMGRKNQESLQAQDFEFDAMKAELEKARAVQRQNEIDLQALGRSEAEAARAQFPNPLPVSEEARRTAITAPMAQGIPRNTFRDLELQAMEMQEPTSTRTGADATNELQSVFGIDDLIDGIPWTKETTLTPDVQYRYDRITSSKAMLDNPYSWYGSTGKKDKPDWALLVDKLYDPKKGQMKDLQNAWEQITISYSENRDIMEKAHDYLLFIDRAEEASKKAQ